MSKHSVQVYIVYMGDKLHDTDSDDTDSAPSHHKRILEKGTSRFIFDPFYHCHHKFHAIFK